VYDNLLSSSNPEPPIDIGVIRTFGSDCTSATVSSFPSITSESVSPQVTENNVDILNEGSAGIMSGTILLSLKACSTDVKGSSEGISDRLSMKLVVV